MRAKIKAAVDADGQALTPAYVMQYTMEVHFRARRYDKAAAIAATLAPYVHARRSAVSISGDIGVRTEVVEELVDAPDPRNPEQNGQAAQAAAGVLPV